ncbi:MAG: ABC transporter permease [Roseivirga sp.]
MSRGKSQKGPSFIAWLLSKIIPEALQEEFLGDLEEIYQHRLLNKSRAYARLMYSVDALHLLIGFGSYRTVKKQKSMSFMFKHHLLTFRRNALRNKSFTLINLLSLATGMGVCLIIYQYIHFEQSYDTFHSNSQNIYRLKRDDLKSGRQTGSILHNHALGPKIIEAVPEIQHMVRVRSHGGGALVVTNPATQQPLKETGILSVDPGFLQIFDFPLSLGDAESALTDDKSVVISEAIASRHFGSENPIGKTLTMRGGVTNGDFIVRGVLSPVPANSHLQFDMLLPLNNELSQYRYTSRDGWTGRDFATYMYIDHSLNFTRLASKINAVIEKHSPRKETPEISFQALTDIHLGPEFSGDPAIGNGSQRDVRLFSIISAFILLIAWVNYINLTTARAMHRAKEVGIRKSVGAFRRQLIGQFMFESVLLNLISAALAIGMAHMALPLLGNVIGKSLNLSLLLHPFFWLCVLLIIIFGSFVSGLYPAFVLSAYKPISMLKGNRALPRHSQGLRKGLITFQFLISLLLISGTYLVNDQITFMKQQELGTDMEKMVIIESHRTKQRWPDHRISQETFKTELKKSAGISAAAGSGRVPGRGFNIRADVRRPGEQPEVSHSGNMIYADRDFVETYGFRFLVRDSLSTADYEGRKVTIINEEAVSTFGFNSPAEALNQKLIFARDTFIIKGVLENFHWHSLKAEHSPYLFLVRPGGRTYFSISINLSNIQETMAFIKETHAEIFPDNPFEFFFLDEDFNRQYQSDLQFGRIFGAFSTLAIFIACIGLFALVSFSATLRIKEIGIRKVLGARTGHLMILLSQEYVRLLLIAITLATPITLYFGRQWLENYAFQTPTGADLILLPAMALVVISIITVTHRTFTTARANPVKALKND